MACYNQIDSPIGPITLTASESGLQSVWIQKTDKNKPVLEGLIHDPAFLREASAQLAAYFASELQQFDLAIDARCGTTFQQQVWRALTTIPFGQTVSYSDIAQQINAPKAVRAVGAANGKNPLAIVVPCHRVIGANGSLTGYAGGMDNKRWLLAHEARCTQGDLLGPVNTATTD